MRKQEIDQILSDMLDSQENVSDLNMTVGKPLQVETSGELVPVVSSLGANQLTSFQTERIALNLLGQNRRLTAELLEQGSCDFSYKLPGKARFRGNVFSQSGDYSLVFRKLEPRVPTIQSMELPDVFYEITRELNGIILVTGATGSGKTTSLAAILDEINDKKAVHVVTLEDPIEYKHPQKKATFNQRELGTDFDTYANGLRAALRQAPKVILVGEMRDRETVDIGLRAAETGHLVLSTLHTVDAGQSINRILGMFNSEEERQIRIRLADSMRWIVSQRLLPKKGGGRVAAFEILRKSLRSKEAIAKGESEGKSFYEIIRAAKHAGMRTFDDHITELYEKDVISEQTALAYASRKAVVGWGIDSIKSNRGEATSQIQDLEIDRKYYNKTQEE